MLELGYTVHVHFGTNWNEIFDLANEVGATLIEIAMDHFEILQQPNLRYLAHRIKDLATKYGLEIGVQSPRIDVNPASLNPHIRATSEKVLLQSLKFAADSGSRYFVLHLGQYNSKYYGKRYYTRAMLNAVSIVRKVIRVAASYGVAVAIINEPKTHGESEYLCVTVNDVKKIVTELPNTYIALDLGHANTVEPPHEYVSKLLDLIDKIYLVKVHDNDGTSDQHLPIGRGKIDLSRVLSLLTEKGFTGPLVVDNFTISDTKTSLLKLSTIVSPYLKRLSTMH